MKCKKQSWKRRTLDLLEKVLPGPWRERRISDLVRLMGKSDPSSEEQLQKRAESFLMMQILTLVVVIMAGLLLILAMKMQEVGGSDEIVVTRNRFGQGDKKVPLILRKGKEGREEKYEWILSEAQMSRQEKEQYADRFFRKLKKKVLEKNRSWSAVDQPLDFLDSLSGYPFEISYRVEDAEAILLDGSLGPRASMLSPDESLATKIQVTAEYGDWTLERTWNVKLVSQKESGSRDPFAKMKDYLTQLNHQDSRAKEITLSGRWKGYQICTERPYGDLRLLIGLIILAGAALPGIRIWKISQQGDLTKKQMEKDFSSIVHRLALYMGSGLSFMSTVDRISKDYIRRREKQGKRYAFEKILAMDRQMKAGVSQTRACRNWGDQFRGTGYQKLALILIQSFTRSTREARAMMDKEEAEAFRSNVDRARKEGEEASTKLLFPMIIMLAEVTLLVMLPAILQFNHF